MSLLAKILLALLIVNSAASVLFMTGIVDVSGVPSLYLTFPLAAILYGMFVICLALDKEVAAFDAERHAHHDHAGPANQPPNIESLHDHEHHESIAA
jgi:hypothetical protein